MTDQPTIETTTGVEFIDKDEFVKDVAEKFGLSAMQSEVVYHMGLGDDLIDAVVKVYSGKAGTKNPGGSYRATSNHYHAATKLINMYKFQQALDYIGDQEFIDLRLNRMKLFLLEWGKKKLFDNAINHNAQVGIWKMLVQLSYVDKLPDDQKRIGQSIEKLTQHFKEMDATRKSMKTLEKDMEDEGESDVTH